MSDLTLKYTEALVGAGHPTLTDTINRLPLVEHNTDGTHDMQYKHLSGYANFAGALLAIGSTATTLILDVAGTVSVNTTIPATLHLVGTAKGLLTVATGVTLTINGPFDAGLFQVFTGAGTVSFAKGAVICPQWFGAKGDDSTDDSAAWVSAIASLPNGGTIDANGKTYLINTQNLAVDVDNLWIENPVLKRTSTTTGWMLTWAKSASTKGGGLVNPRFIGNAAVAASGGCLMGAEPYYADEYAILNFVGETFGQYGLGIENGNKWLIDGVRILQHGLTSGVIASCMGFYVYPKSASHGGVLSNVYSEISDTCRDNTDANTAAVKLQTHQNLNATNITAKYGLNLYW